MDMNQIRQRIDKIDADMVELYKQRMEAVSEIGEYKRANKLPIYDLSLIHILPSNFGEGAI